MNNQGYFHSASAESKIKRGGFSLIEITLAIGIVSFAFVAILGLVPTGLKTFRSAINTSVSGQIFQRVINEAQQTDFATLTNAAGFRYFDDQGSDQDAQGALLTKNSPRVIYHVNTCISPSTVLTSTNGTAVPNTSLATVTVQIASNPGNVPLGTAVGTMWPSNAPVPILTQSTMVSRNQ